MPKTDMPKKAAKLKEAKTHANTPEKTRVLIQFIQDRSGSMDNMWNETVNGFKTFIKSLRAETNVDYRFTLTVFDDVIETPLNGIPIQDVPLDVLANFGPRGGTALYDAIGRSLQSAEKWGDFDAQKIVVVIVTDGQENCSREYTKQTIHTAIDVKLKSGKYTFTYCGTQPETWADAAVIGMNARSTVVYQPGHVSATYSVMADSLNNFARSAYFSSSNLVGTYSKAGTADAAGMTVSDEKDVVEDDNTDTK